MFKKQQCWWNLQLVKGKQQQPMESHSKFGTNKENHSTSNLRINRIPHTLNPEKNWTCDNEVAPRNFQFDRKGAAQIRRPVPLFSNLKLAQCNKSNNLHTNRNKHLSDLPSSQWNAKLLCTGSSSARNRSTGTPRSHLEALQKPTQNAKLRGPG